MDNEDALLEGNNDKLKDLKLWARIGAIDLSKVKASLMTKEISGEKWSEQKASAVEQLYRRHLYLTQIADHPVIPARDVDEFWHQHILYTREYLADCQTMFGAFLHHRPLGASPTGDDLRRHQETLAKTRDLYFGTFGVEYATLESGECSGGPAGDSGCGTP